MRIGGRKEWKKAEAAHRARDERTAERHEVGLRNTESRTKLNEARAKAEIASIKRNARIGGTARGAGRTAQEPRKEKSLDEKMAYYRSNPNKKYATNGLTIDGQDTNREYSKDYLATTDFVDDYNTSYKQALGLGIFGADLGYQNMYNKTGGVIDYISAIKTLADGIRVGQFFDFTTLKRLVTNNENLDSLMYISVQNFNRMDRYLRENNRSNLSSLIVAGVWIESMYLLGEVVKESPNADLSEKIGEQRIILSNLMILLRNYERDPRFKDLIADLSEIQEIYIREVTITYERGEPETIIEDGMLTIKQNDKQYIDISNETLFKIIDKTAEVRNKIIQL